MIPIIAWRNIWRNTTRSLVIIMSVALGLWAGIFIMALSFGVTEERKASLIKEYISHIQIHTPAFKDRQELAQFIPDGPEILQRVQKDSLVQVASGRMLIYGMLSAAQGSGGVQITGVDPAAELALTAIDQKLVEGEYFPDKKNRIFIGQALAEKYHVKVGSKIVLTFQDTSANMVAGAFRICGLYKTADAKRDERLVYVRSTDIQELLNTGPMLHEIAMLAPSYDDVPVLHSALKSEYTDLVVEDWRELSPELRYLDEMMDVFLYVFIGIILFALAFGLVNTMLMAVLERVRELGMMMAIGMTKTRLFFVILLETCYLALTGTLVGFVLGYLTVLITSQTGISLSMVEQGMAEFGMSSVLYPYLDLGYYPTIGLMVIVFAVLSAIYPAVKALQLNPTEAIRKV